MMDDKYNNLKARLKEMESVVVAFSGGVDSTFLLAVAFETLGERVIAVTARSETYPVKEYESARKIATFIGARHFTIETDELDDPEYIKNPPERCYFCKKELFTALKKVGIQEERKYVVEGSNADDLHDFRPGRKAAKELDILAPLAEAGLTKAEIRVLSRKLGLPTWDKPALACLASRIPYGTRITVEKLHRIDRAEEAVRSMGIAQVRVRDHGDVARIEVGTGDFYRFLIGETRSRIESALKRAGFQYVALDLAGYRTGSMNEILGTPRVADQGI
jgi:uncharacterized protein